MKFLMTMLIAVAAVMSFGGEANAQTPVGFDTIYPVISAGGECFSPAEAYQSALAVWQPAVAATLATIPPAETVVEISSTMVGPYIFNVRQVYIEETDEFVDMYTCTIQGGIRTTVNEPAP